MDAPTLERSDEIASAVDQSNVFLIENLDDTIKTKPSDLKKIKSRRTWIIGISSAFIFTFALSLLLFLLVFSEDKGPNEQPDFRKMISNKIRENDIRIQWLNRHCIRIY
jgi:hypothetical protein